MFICLFVVLNAIEKTTPPPRKSFRGGFEQSISHDLVKQSDRSRPKVDKSHQWLEERTLDTPVKGLLWKAATFPEKVAGQAHCCRLLLAVCLAESYTVRYSSRSKNN